jgi:transcriptional regulator with XRE-family HTH domain
MIGEAVKFFREERKLTQFELSDLVGMSQKTISIIEANQRDVSDDELKKFSQVLMVPENILRAQKSYVQHISNSTVDKGMINAQTYVEGKEGLYQEMIESDKKQISFLQEMVTKLNDTLTKLLPGSKTE